jgi:hypothetical protein
MVRITNYNQAHCNFEKKVDPELFHNALQSWIRYIDNHGMFYDHDRFVNCSNKKYATSSPCNRDLVKQV